jgi:LPXTG-motif cell wall-anchored protein
MRISRLVAGVVGTGLLLLGPSALAAQPTYPLQAPKLTVSATSINAGDTVTVTGTGLLAGSNATVTWTGAGALGAAGRVPGMAAGGFRMGTRALTADSNGVVTTGVRLTSAGDHTITLAGTAADGSPVSLSTTVTVNAAPAPSSALPHTGAPLLTYTGVGLALVLLGALVVMVVRKRRRDTASVPVTVAAPVEHPVSQ